jgi:hypothetical protein
MNGSTSNEVLTVEDELGRTKTEEAMALFSSTVLEFTWAGRDENHEKKLVRMDLDACFRNCVVTKILDDGQRPDAK